jgi:hypothetical protein
MRVHIRSPPDDNTHTTRTFVFAHELGVLGWLVAHVNSRPSVKLDIVIEWEKKQG